MLLHTIDWNKTTAVTGIVAIIVAIIIPFIIKLYEERKSKFSFKMYIKSQFGYIYNSATYEKYTYFLPTIKDEPEKQELTLGEFARKIKEDYIKHQNSIQPRVIFHFINNVQNFCFTLLKIRSTISSVDIRKIKENTLSHGDKMPNEYLKDIYGLALILDSFGSISTFHDRFDKLQSLIRIKDNHKWIGLKTADNLLENQQILLEDMKTICNHESNLMELLGISVVLHDKLKEYYEVAEASALSDFGKEIVEKVVENITNIPIRF